MLREGDMFGPASDPYDAALKGSGMVRQVVVWIDPQQNMVALHELQSGDWPWLDELDEVVARIERERMILESESRLLPEWLNRKITDVDRDRRDAKMATIRPLVESAPCIFNRKERGRLIGDIHRDTGIARNTIKEWLKRFYAGGRCANALLDRYDLCGHRLPGDTKSGWKKLGRPNHSSLKPPENVTPELRKQFGVATDREVKFTGKVFMISKAHKRWKEENCYVPVEVDGARKLRLADRYDEMSPATYDQFLRWYKDDGRHEKTSRKVLGSASYEKDNRPLTSTSTFETSGPCSRYQIDATVWNFAVTSVARPDLLLGRPYLYFVRDVWSRMIMGYYFGLQPPSQVTASLALMSAFTSKVPILEEFGFNPETDPWMGHYLCGALLHDGGELTGHWGDYLAGKEKIIFETASPERGDLKGAVELIFHWSDVEWSRTTKGRVAQPGYKAPAMRNADLKAAEAGDLDTIWEAERKVIQFCLNFNNHYVLKDYDPDPDMLAAGIPRVPGEMFKWGINARGAPRTPDPDLVRYHLMPRHKVRVYKDGIHFHNAVFDHELLGPLKAKARQTGKTVPLEISDDLTGYQIFLHTDDSTKLIKCGLAHRDRAVEGLRFEDADALKAARAAREQVEQEEEDRKSAEQTLAKARKDKERKRPTPGPKRTVAQKKADNAKARQQTRKQERRTSFSDATSEASPEDRKSTTGGATIHRLPVPTPPLYSIPDLEDFDDD